MFLSARQSADLRLSVTATHRHIDLDETSLICSLRVSSHSASCEDVNEVRTVDGTQEQEG